MLRRSLLIPFALVLAFVVAFGAACGDDDEDGDNGDASPAATVPADGVETQTNGAETPSDGAETPAAGMTPAAGGGDGTTVEIAAENAEEFTESELSASAGEITVIFENRDDGVTHNFALYDSPDSPEDLIDATELTAGPDTQEMTVTLEAGEYYFNCQVHPAMEGVLTAE